MTRPLDKLGIPIHLGDRVVFRNAEYIVSRRYRSSNLRILRPPEHGLRSARNVPACDVELVKLVEPAQ